MSIEHWGHHNPDYQSPKEERDQEVFTAHLHNDPNGKYYWVWEIIHQNGLGNPFEGVGVNNHLADKIYTWVPKSVVKLDGKNHEVLTAEDIQALDLVAGLVDLNGQPVKIAGKAHR